MIQLKDILKEDEVSDKFGNVAFGEDPNIAKMQGKKTEEDTKFEEKLLTALIGWTVDSSTQLANKLYDNFPLLKKASKKFPSVLQPLTPNGTEVYRGVKHPNKKLIEKLEKTKKEDWTKQQMGTYVFYKYSKPVKYTPRRKVQSWTSSKKVAAQFSFASKEGVCLTTIQNEEFLFNENLIKKIYGGQNEKELLHFGQKFKNQIYILVSPNFWRKLPSKGVKK